MVVLCLKICFKDLEQVLKSGGDFTVAFTGMSVCAGHGSLFKYANRTWKEGRDKDVKVCSLFSAKVIRWFLIAYLSPLSWKSE